MKYRLLSPPAPNAMILFCPLCDLEVHRTLPGDLRFPEVIAYESERACALHLLEHHRLRFWLWGRLRWDWLVKGMGPS